MSIYHFDIVDGREIQDRRGPNFPRRRGPALWAATCDRAPSCLVCRDGEKRTFVKVVDENGKIIARRKVEELTRASLDI